MAYDFYLDKLLLPVTPSDLQIKIGKNNKTYTLINEGEINVLKSAKLTDISFDVLIPAVRYGFASYKNDIFLSVAYFLEQFETLKTSKKPFQFIVNRTLPNGTVLFDTNITVSLEDYTIKEDSDNGFDVTVSVSLKQYRDYGTKSYTVNKKKDSKKTTATAKKKRSVSKNKPKTNTTYKVKKGDSLWKIAKKFYGDGSKYTVIYKANKKKIKNPSLIYVGQVLTIPAA